MLESSGPSGIGPGSGAAIVASPGAAGFTPFESGSASCGCAVQPEGTACDDGSPCTTVDTCSGGQCSGSVPLDCDDGLACTIDTCGPSGCIHTADCDDGLGCTVDSCGPSGCVHAEQCDDANPCTADSCAANGCMHTGIGGTCDDGNACTGGDHCSSSHCVGTVRDCDDGNPCTDDGCVPATGECASTNDDTNGCSLSGSCAVCAAGACVPGTPSCDDGIGCTVDSCDGATGQCVHTPDDASCRNGDYCDVSYCSEIFGGCVTQARGAAEPCRVGCSPGRCFSTTCGIVFFYNCNYPANCGLQTCDQNTGLCVDHPDACDDGLPCTVDACQSFNGFGNCTHTAPQCDDSDGCTVDSCAASGACTHTPLGCYDGNPCTTDACAGGSCVFTPATPDEVAGVNFSSKTRLQWNGESGAAYNVVRGVVSALPVGSHPTAEVCANVSDGTSLGVSNALGAGTAWWFVVRRDYGSCKSSYGFAEVNGTPGNERVTNTCP